MLKKCFIEFMTEALLRPLKTEETKLKCASGWQLIQTAMKLLQ